jgi:protein-tyrosine phosphatase
VALLNFRDVASTPGTDPLAPGRLFRSAQPFHLTAAEVGEVRDAGIRTVVDLRGADERVAPDWDPLTAADPDIEILRVPLSEQVMAAGANLPGAGLLWRGEITVGDFLGAFYRAVVDHAEGGLARIVTAVADGGPVLLHCAAGKDRTGTSVALLLDLLGVSQEAIVADYLRTNEASDAILAQLAGSVPEAERVDPVTMPPGLHTAPETAVRQLLEYLDRVGGAREVLGRGSDQATLDRAVAALSA